MDSLFPGLIKMGDRQIRRGGLAATRARGEGGREGGRERGRESKEAGGSDDLANRARLPGTCQYRHGHRRECCRGSLF